MYTISIHFVDLCNSDVGKGQYLHLFLFVLYLLYYLKNLLPHRRFTFPASYHLFYSLSSSSTFALLLEEKSPISIIFKDIILPFFMVNVFHPALFCLSLNSVQWVSLFTVKQAIMYICVILILVLSSVLVTCTLLCFSAKISSKKFISDKSSSFHVS